MPSHTSLFQNIDLNLLVALSALIETAHVTRAAKKLGVSQSAMSHTLRRLRDVFGDSLLVRSRGGMVLTPRAEQMRRPLLDALQNLEGIVRSTLEFEPATSTAEFSIGASEFMQLLFLPQLTELLSREAPGLRLHVWTPGAQTAFQLLESGGLDVFLGSVLVNTMAEETPGVMRRELGRESMACAARRGHPQIGSEGLTLEAYTRLSHILISPIGKGPGLVDAQLEKLGKERRIAVWLSSFLVAPWVAASSDHILTAPRRVIDAYQYGLGLDVHEPPLELRPVPITMFWHERSHVDRARQWLRDAIARAYATKPHVDHVPLAERTNGEGGKQRKSRASARGAPRAPR